MSETTTIIAVSLSAVVMVTVVGCIVYIRCFSKLEEEQEAWGRKSIDLDGPPQLPMYELPKSFDMQKSTTGMLLAHDDEYETRAQGADQRRNVQPNAERYSYHTHQTTDRDEGESKFTETTVGRFFENLDEAQEKGKAKNQVEDDSDDDIDV